jgi:hypothetical protein
MARTDGIVLVIDRARGGQPYVATVDLLRIYRQISPTQMEGLPIWEAQLVEHLLDTGEFVRDSKVMRLTCGEYTRPVVRLEAPRRSDAEVQPGKGGDVR